MNTINIRINMPNRLLKNIVFALGCILLILGALSALMFSANPISAHLNIQVPEWVSLFLSALALVNVMAGICMVEYSETMLPKTMNIELEEKFYDSVEEAIEALRNHHLANNRKKHVDTLNMLEWYWLSKAPFFGVLEVLCEMHTNEFQNPHHAMHEMMFGGHTLTQQGKSALNIIFRSSYLRQNLDYELAKDLLLDVNSMLMPR